MRFRLIRRDKGRGLSVPVKPAPSPAAPPPPRAAELDNPYGRVFGQARRREDLKREE